MFLLLRLSVVDAIVALAAVVAIVEADLIVIGAWLASERLGMTGPSSRGRLSGGTMALLWHQ
jgi:hypothetical protein